MTEEVKRCVEALRMCPIPGYGCCDCPVYVPGKPCQNEIKAAALIESLSAQLEQVTRERDALLDNIHGNCCKCVHYRECSDTVCETSNCTFCVCGTCIYGSNWQWRGVREEGLE